MIMSNIQMIKVKVSSTFAFGRDFAITSVFHKTQPIIWLPKIICIFAHNFKKRDYHAKNYYNIHIDMFL